MISISLEQHYQELLEEKSILYDENIRLRETIGTIEEEDRRLRQDVASCQSMITAYQLREERRKSYLRADYLGKLSNRVIALEAIELLEQKSVDTQKPTRIIVEQLAASVGMTPGPTGQTLKRLDEMGILKYEQGPRAQDDDGNWYTPSMLATTAITNTPGKTSSSIKVGGPRKKGCTRCGSLDTDSYTVEYCRACQRTEIMGQIGLRDDHNIMDMINGLGFNIQEMQDIQKQLAFGANEPKSPASVINLPCQSIPTLDDKLILEETPIVLEENPVTPPLSPSVSDVVTNWLRDRIGNGRIIVATGKLEQDDKYITKPASYTPDLEAYLAGQASHIYGSWLRDPETGLTRVLCFEIDKSEHDALGYDFLVTLAAAGASPVYWQRYAQGRTRGHLELYFDRPVNAEQARAWCIDVCPQLGAIPECYPYNDKANNALSWPLYQRIGKDIYPCTALAMVPTGDLFEVAGDNLAQLGELVTRAVTPSALFDGYPVPPQSTTCKPKGGALLESPFPTIPVLSDKDLARQIIAEQNAALTWDMIADRCGGLKRGKFCAVWRGERTPSVTINKDGQRATDWGQTGTAWPRNFDKYEAWCMIEGVKKKDDLAQRCKNIRQYQKSALAVPSSSAREEFYV